tara:strand:- start:786 stop:1097 length:312 start_codon:yes stop_codon:yes gene_type:complete
MEVVQSDFTLVTILAEFGFAIVAVVGLAYFIYYIWNFISDEIDPKIEEMHLQLIRVIDQVRMLDQDLIRLQEKVNVVLEYRERQQFLDDAEEKVKNEKRKTKR